MRATAALGQDVARPRPEAQTCACRGTPKIDQGAPVLPRKGQEGSIRKADRLFLADVEGLGIALAAALEGRRHGNRAALQLRQPDRRASLGRQRLRELGGFLASRDDNTRRGVRSGIDDRDRGGRSLPFRLLLLLLLRS